jgi:hypothetical protein
MQAAQSDHGVERMAGTQTLMATRRPLPPAGAQSPQQIGRSDHGRSLTKTDVNGAARLAAEWTFERRAQGPQIHPEHGSEIRRTFLGQVARSPVLGQRHREGILAWTLGRQRHMRRQIAGDRP